MNCAVISVGSRAIVVDCGVTFPDDDVYGIDQIAPDVGFLAERADDIEAILITHGHQDHLGALALLLEEIDVPVYAPPYAAALIRHHLEENNFSPRDYEIIETSTKGTYDIGPFQAEFAQVNHSIPDAFATALRYAGGLLVHTGDFKIDPESTFEPPADEAKLRAWGKEGVRMLFSDSTNIERSGRAGSETNVKIAMQREISRSKQRFIVTMFSTNMFRVQALIDVAYATGRKFCLLGRSLQRNSQLARDLGLLKIPDSGLIIDAEDAAKLPDSQVIIACTGSQAQPRAALKRIATGTLAGITIKPGDQIIFSARSIPGNEAHIARLMDDIARCGGTMVHAPDLHCSGHGYKEDQADMIRWTKPDVFVPVHGDYRYLRQHADLAESLGVKRTHVLENGEVLELSRKKSRVIEKLKFERLAVDGSTFGIYFGEALKQRRRMAMRGMCLAAMVIQGETGEILEPVTLKNLGLHDAEFDDGLLADAQKLARKAMQRLGRADRRKAHRVEELLSVELVRFFKRETGRRPLIQPVVQYL
ncbi:MAG: ribonuclease J [Bradymonadia bacterium]|jgi:ribonuclease J